jgi:hypothetical protein
MKARTVQRMYTIAMALLYAAATLLLFQIGLNYFVFYN